ncbi:MAG: DEAD/DEAH box helicase [Treponema sp.]|nr:DEAD/DEAH box helicase [Treponema sp.]
MEDTVSFEDLGLNVRTLEAIKEKGFLIPSPIQVLTIPRLLQSDTNIIAKARTGTGKTAAFGLPLVQKITQDKGFVQAVVLTPTRELALQVSREINSFCLDSYPRITTVYGGQSIGGQIKDVKRGTEIVVGTPGRIIDLIDRGALKFSDISYFILDEADEMLDMGFIDDIRQIFSHTNESCRVLLFSATMPKPILEIASEFMGDYDIVEEDEKPEEPVLTEQRFWFVRENEKIEALVRLIDISPDFYGLVFTQTKVDADAVTKQLDEKGYDVAALHGDIPQNQREKILLRFRRKKTRIMVATDVAARGIDIEGLTHVINFSMPFDVPTYIHRIGRTGRAGAKGLAFTFVRPEEKRRLDFLRRSIQKNIKGEMKEELVPSVEQVLAVKRKHLFERLKNDLINEDEFKENTTELDIENEENDIAKNNTFYSDDVETIIEKRIPQLINVPSEFAKMAEKLCRNYDASELLGAVLTLSYGKQIDPKRYGKITPVRQSLGNVAGEQVRLYVSLGRRDGFGPREVASYLSGLLRIPPNKVDKIDMAENFCLVNLPTNVAKIALEKSRRDKKIPHMHIDEKADQFTDFSTDNRKNKGKESFGRGKGAFRKTEGSSRRAFANDSESRGDSFKKSGKFDHKRSGLRKSLSRRSNRTSDASLYTKSSGQNY